MFKSLKKMKWVLPAVLVLGFSVFFVSCDSYETAAYQVKKKDGAFEIRDYEELTLVSAPMEDGEKKSENGSFRKLFKYISKGNEKQEKIAMTTPVFMGDSGEGKRMSFVLPKKIAKADAPKPNDKNVKISVRKAATFAVYKYSGNSKAKDNEEATKKLKAWLDKSDYKAVGEVIRAGYNPPWTPGPMRRNEVLLEVKKK